MQCGHKGLTAGPSLDCELFLKVSSARLSRYVRANRRPIVRGGLDVEFKVLSIIRVNLLLLVVFH